MAEGFERSAGNSYAFRLHIKYSTALFPIISQKRIYLGMAGTLFVKNYNSGLGAIVGK